MTAADRPPVTDNARAEAERHYPAPNADDETLTYPRSAVREHARGGFVKGYEAGWAAARAETTTAHECDSGDFDRTICGCGAMHSYCTGCGTRQDDCRAETTTATTEDAARVIDDACYGGASSPQEIAQALADAGLLATARTRPTRTIYSVQHWEDADGIRASWVTGYGQYTHSHEDAEATLRHQERQHPDTTFRLAQAEVTAWTEADRG